MRVTLCCAVTAPGTIVKSDPAIVDEGSGRMAALLELTLYGGRCPPPEMTNEIGTPEYAVAVAGEMVNAIAGSTADETAPLPHAPSKTASNPTKNIVAHRSIARKIVTSTSFRVLRHYSNKIAKVLACIGILPKARSHFIIRASCNPRIVLPLLDSAQDKNVAARKMRRYYRSFQELSICISVLGTQSSTRFIENLRGHEPTSAARHSR